jgi:ubiquinone/menaquinone biosynthesis C-methylase UbiE
MQPTILDPEQVKRQYTDWAHKYDSELEGTWQYVGPREVAAGVREFLKPGSRIADIGCGTGLAFQFFPNSQITGFDFCDQMLREAAAKIEGLKQQDTEVRLQLADITNLPAPDNSFDAAISVSVSEHITDLSAMIREMRKIVVPDGVIAFTAPQTQLDGCIARSKSEVSELLMAENLPLLKVFGYRSHFEYAMLTRPAIYNCFICWKLK